MIEQSPDGEDHEIAPGLEDRRGQIHESGPRGGLDDEVGTALIDHIRSAKKINELKHVAESTLTAIMGRMAAYTGRPVTWDQALNSQEVLMPEPFDLSASRPTPPVPMPGQTTN